MDHAIKILILFSILAIGLPIAFPQKFLSWLPPYGPSQDNIFQIAGARLAHLSESLSPIDKNTVPDTNFDKLPATPTASPATTTESLSTINQTSKNNKIPQKPYRILLIGDSFIAVAGGFGQIMESKLLEYDQTAVFRRGKVSSGLSRPDYYDWNAESAKLAKEINPNIVIIMMGTNDAQNFNFENNGKIALALFGSDIWKTEYLRRANKLIQNFAHDDTRIYWIGLPAMRDHNYDTKIKTVSELQKKAAFDQSNTQYIPVDNLTDTDVREYQPFVADSNNVMRATRNPDGTHLSYFGGNLLADKIITLLKKDFDLNLKQKPQ